MRRPQRRQVQRLLVEYNQKNLELGDSFGVVTESLSIFNHSIEILAGIAEDEKTHATATVGRAQAATRLSVRGSR